MLVGIIFLFLGVLYLLSAVIPGFSVDFHTLWPLLLILIAVYNIYRKKKTDTFMVILLFIGIWYMLINNGILRSSYNDVFWAILVIIVGVSIIYSTYSFNKDYKDRKLDKSGVNDSKFITYNGIFGGIEEKVKDDDFKGANVYSIFGAVDLDLTGVKITEDVIINIYSVFGGSTVKLPTGYNVTVNSTAVLGGCDNTNDNKYDKKNKTIYVNSVAVLGGTEVK